MPINRNDSFNSTVYLVLLFFRDFIGDADALHFLSAFLPLVYSTSSEVGKDSDEAVKGGGESIRPLGMLYEMVWSHSEFLEVMASANKGRGDNI